MYRQLTMNEAGANIDVYERLANILDETPQGFPRMKSGVELKLLRLVFTPEEVSLASYLTTTYEYPVDVAGRAGIDALDIFGGMVLQARSMVLEVHFPLRILSELFFQHEMLQEIFQCCRTDEAAVLVVSENSRCVVRKFL